MDCQTDFDIPFLAPYLNMKPDSNSKPNGVMKLANSFVDSNKQTLRISVNMADVGSIRLPYLADVQKRADELFDTAHYQSSIPGLRSLFSREVPLLSAD